MLVELHEVQAHWTGLDRTEPTTPAKQNRTKPTGLTGTLPISILTSGPRTEPGRSGSHGSAGWTLGRLVPWSSIKPKRNSAQTS